MSKPPYLCCRLAGIRKEVGRGGEGGLSIAGGLLSCTVCGPVGFCCVGSREFSSLNVLVDYRALCCIAL